MRKFIPVSKWNHQTNIAILSEIESIMVANYGPLAGLSFLTNQPGFEYSSRDGATVLRELTSDYVVSKMFINTIRNASLRNDAVSGDGSTTTSLLIIALYRMAVRNKIKHIPKYILEEIRKIVTDNKKVINTNVLEDAIDDVYNVAKVSLNNSSEKAEIFRTIVKDLYDRDLDINKAKFVAVKSGRVNNELVKYTIMNGVQTIGRPLISNTKDWSNKKFRVINIGHNLVDAQHVVALIDILTVAYSGGFTTPILFTAPRIDSFVKDELAKALAMLSTSRGMDFDFEMIELIHPLATDELNASEEMSVMLDSTAVSISPICILKGTNYVPANDKEKPSAIKAMYDIGSDVILTDDAATQAISISVVAPSTSQALKSRKEFLIESLTKSIEGESSLNLKEIYTVRLSILTNIAIMLEIGGTSNEESKLLTDMYRDACNHVNSSLEHGVIGGANIGMIIATSKVLNDINKETEGNAIVVDWNGSSALVAIIDAYKYLFDKLCDSSDDMESMDMITTKYSDAESFDITKSFNILTGKETNDILSSANMELRMLASAVEIVNQWLDTKQVVFDSEMSRNMYDIYTNELDEIEKEKASKAMAETKE